MAFAMSAMSEELDKILDTNLRFKHNIDKYVRVETVDSNKHEGWLHTIDPMSGNLFLLTFDDDLTYLKSIDLIMGHAYSSLEMLKEPDEKMKEVFRIIRFDGKTVPLNEEERKERLIACINKNRLPLEMKSSNQVLLVCGSVTVTPPYDADSCQSPSRLTLRNMRKIITTMDKEILKEFEEKKVRLVGKPKVSKETAPAPVDLEERKNNLIAWIKKNRHPVKERDNHSLVVYDNVKIYPPYDVKNVRSSNPRALRSMRKLITQMDKQASEVVDEQSK